MYGKVVWGHVVCPLCGGCPYPLWEVPLYNRPEYESVRSPISETF